MRRSIFLFAVCITIVITSSPVAAQTDHVVLSQLQVAGATANDEWIELYNPTLTLIDLSSFSLQYKSATGSTFQKKNFGSGATIAAHGYYLIAHNDSSVASTANMAHSSFAMAGSGGNIFLVNTTTLLPSPTDASIVDRIGYGTGNAPEGSTAPAPASGQSLQRLPTGTEGNGTDTDNNAANFVLTSSPTAHNTQSPVQPAIPVSNTTSPSTTTPATDSSASSTNTTSSTTTTASTTESTTTSSETSTTTQSSSQSTGTASNQSSTASSSESSTNPSTAASSAASNASSTDTADASKTTNAAAQSTSAASVVRINEILARPATGENEWIELFFSGGPFPLSSWTLEDGKGVISTLDATPTNRWFVVELSSTHLNNDGDTVILKDSTGTIIDRMTYGSFDDGNSADNASTPGQGVTLNRYPDGKDTDSDNIDWYVSTSTTKGSNNHVVAPPPPQSSSTHGQSSTASNDTQIPNVRVNEFVSDPADGDTEWIELVNKDSFAVSINGWSIEDGSGAITPLSGTIGASDANRFYLIASPNGSLNNGGDLILLKNQDRQIVDQVAYGDWRSASATNAPEARDPWSVARVVDGYRSGVLKKDFAITTTPTPQARNVILAPVVRTPTPPPATGSSSTEGSAATSKTSPGPTLLINELFPNPIGADRSHEWLELINRSAAAVDLPRLIIEIRGGARTAITPFRLAGNSTTALPETIPPLPNTGSTIRLLVEEKDTKGRVTEKELDRVSYPSTIAEGTSYAMSAEGRWQWTTTPTPGAINAIASPNQPPVAQFWIAPTAAEGQVLLFDASDSYDADHQQLTYHWAFSDGTTLDGLAVEKVMPPQKRLTATLTVSDGVVSDSIHDSIALETPEDSTSTTTTTTASSTGSKKTTTVASQRVELADIYDLDRNTEVITQGVVSATPQTFGGSTFTLAGSGTMIKLSGRHKWPTLAIGDRVQVHGKISITQTGTSIRVNQPADIIIKSHGAAPAPTPLTLSDVIDRETNDLVTITAAVRDVRAKSWLVEDQENEIVVVTPTQLPRIPQPQESVRITGVIEHTSTANRLRPRSADDIAFLSSAAPSSSITIPRQSNSKMPAMVFTAILAVSLLLLIIREPRTARPPWPTPEPKPVVATNGILQLPTSFQTEKE